MKLRIITVVVVAVVLFLAWYAFRPERLFVNRTVHEDSKEAMNLREQPLASGTFHSVLHPTQGNASVYRVSDGSRILRFTNFTTSNGPDVHIYMVANEEPKTTPALEMPAMLIWG